MPLSLRVGMTTRVRDATMRVASRDPWPEMARSDYAKWSATVCRLWRRPRKFIVGATMRHREAMGAGLRGAITQ